ncbi:hypothetical protein ACJX0J_022080, partial [Zea mays]
MQLKQEAHTGLVFKEKDDTHIVKHTIQQNESRVHNYKGNNFLFKICIEQIHVLFSSKNSHDLANNHSMFHNRLLFHAIIIMKLTFHWPIMHLIDNLIIPSSPNVITHVKVSHAI